MSYTSAVQYAPHILAKGMYDDYYLITAGYWEYRPGIWIDLVQILDVSRGIIFSPLPLGSVTARMGAYCETFTGDQSILAALLETVAPEFGESKPRLLTDEEENSLAPRPISIEL